MPSRHRAARRDLDSCPHAGPFGQRTRRAFVQKPAYPVRISVPAGRDVRDDGRVQLGEPDRWPGRPGDRADHHRRRRVRIDRLSRWQPDFRRLSADQFHFRRRRIDGVPLQPDRRGIGVFVVQRAAGRRVHGRHRLPLARRCFGLGCGRHQKRNRAGDRRWPVRGGNRLCHRAGFLVQAHWPPGVSDGAAAPSF